MKTYYHRKLPHWIPPEAIFFITFRLANSLPAAVLQALAEEKEREREKCLSQFTGGEQKQQLYNLEKKYFGRFDNWLDRCIGESPRWLLQEKVARIVVGSIHELDGKRYTLMAACIMPNHVHLLIDTQGIEVSAAHQGATAGYPLADTLKQLKGRTARFANQALGRTGAFWQHESYDHVVRNAQELERIHWYILNNPVKAGLVFRWHDWRYCWSKINLA
jgi:REP element-mobilizing transposase RayT